MSFARFDWRRPLVVLFVAMLSSCSDGGGGQSTKSFVPGFIEPTSAERQDPFAGRQAGQVRDDNSLKTKLVWIPAGRFWMGSPPDEVGRSPVEEQVAVTLTRGFWLGQHELTQAEWRRLMRTAPWSRFVDQPGQPDKGARDGDDYPAIFVSHADAMEFCERLTQDERRAGRIPANWEYSLPTEAQWEYACRAGTTTAYPFGDSAADLGAYAWYGATLNNSDVKDIHIHRVCQKKPNPWGLYDMHGNVDEWLRDEVEKKLPGGTDPFVARAEWGYGIRGGDWSVDSNNCRCAKRGGISEGREYEVGFRLAAVPSVK